MDVPQNRAKTGNHSRPKTQSLKTGTSDWAWTEVKKMSAENSTITAKSQDCYMAEANSLNPDLNLVNTDGMNWGFNEVWRVIVIGRVFALSFVFSAMQTACVDVLPILLMKPPQWTSEFYRVIIPDPAATSSSAPCLFGVQIFRDCS